MSEHRLRKEPPVNGDKASVVCSTCGHDTVLCVYRHEEVAVMFCASCERSWLAPAAG